MSAAPSAEELQLSNQVAQFLQLLGKPAGYVRYLDPLKRRKAPADALCGAGGSTPADVLAQADGRNTYMVIGNADSIAGRNARDSDISSMPALFVEWDDGADIEAQSQRWQQLGIPEPTVMVATGGKSVHAYWTLEQPMAPDAWRRLVKRLISHCNSDKACCNPSRVMRLPGSTYYSKTTGEPTGQCRIIAAGGTRYSADLIAACLPAPAAHKLKPSHRTDWAPRGIDEINAAAEYIPRRVGGEGTYEQDRNALCGCAAALAEAGVTDPDAAALALLGHLWPAEAAARQVLASTSTRNAASFWAIAAEHGYKLKRSSTGKERGDAQLTEAPWGSSQKGSHETFAEAVGASWQDGKTFIPRPDTGAKWGKRSMGHTKAMRCFDRCVETLAKRERNSLTRRARLLKILKALDLHQCINRQEISQRVLQAKDEQQGNGYHGLTAEERLAMEWPEVEWLIPNLLPANDLSIIGGRPKVGKTAFAMAIAAAVLTGCEVAGCPRPDSTRPVIVISDDASDADTRQVLMKLGIFGHPNLIWSRNFRLTETDIDRLLINIEQHPGAVVILDSLRSVARHLEKGENDPEIGAVIYDIKEAVMGAGGSLVMIHHCNKAEGLVGVEALSGHNAISGAANTVLTLHHVTDANGKPNKEAEQRRLHREGRSGEMRDCVISRTAGSGTFHYVSSWSSWQEQIKEAEAQAKRESSRTDAQRDVLELLEQHPGEWLTCRQVVEALGLEWGRTGAGKDANRVRDALKRLAQEKEVQEARSGQAYTYSALLPEHYESQKPQKSQKAVTATVLTSEVKSQKPQKAVTATALPSEIDPQKANALQRSASEASEASEAMPPRPLLPSSHSATADLVEVVEPLEGRSGWPAWGHALLAIRAEHPHHTAWQLANEVTGASGLTVSRKDVEHFLALYSSQQEAS